MKKIYKPGMVLLLSGALLFSCSGNTDSTDGITVSEKDDQNQSQTDVSENSLYGSVDSTFEIGNETFVVHVNQYDLTQKAYAEGDTFPRPTFLCQMEIYSSTGTVLYQDSLTRDSWGYPGKIESIDAYQITLPELFFKDGEIIASYRIYEMNSLDAILGSVAFDVNSYKTRLYWEESYLE